MKKFVFSLDKVLNYKNQVLDSLLSEQAAILAEVKQQEKKIEGLREQYTQCCRELNKRQLDGMIVGAIYAYENYLEILDYQVKEEQKVLLVLKQKEAVKREQVIEARKETASLDKLKEKKEIEYNKAVQKEEERFVEEFVSNMRNKQVAV